MEPKHAVAFIMFEILIMSLVQSQCHYCLDCNDFANVVEGYMTD